MTHFLVVRVIASSTATSFPFPFAVLAESRARFVVEVDEVAAAEEDDAAFTLSFSFCFALTLALERNALVSAGTVAAVGCWADGVRWWSGCCWCSWLSADGFCWVKSI